MPSRLPQSRNWCTTIHLKEDHDWPTEEELSTFTHLPHLVSCVIGRETGEEGETRHLQCLFCFSSPVTPKALNDTIASIASLKPAHHERARDVVAAWTYCTKEDNAAFTFGDKPERQPGKRRDISALRDDIRDGVRCRKTLRERHDIAVRCPEAVERLLADYRPKPRVPDITLRPWQATLIEIIRGEPDPRRIHVIVDPTGGAGKSTFATYLRATFDKVQVLSPGRHSDLSYLLDEETRILIMDCPRSTSERIPWCLCESIKNGYVQSTKYTPVIKELDPVHVLVFTNDHPDETQLSQDRWDITVV